MDTQPSILSLRDIRAIKSTVYKLRFRQVCFAEIYISEGTVHEFSVGNIGFGKVAVVESNVIHAAADKVCIR